jgi:hypothetical protein
MLARRLNGGRLVTVDGWLGEGNEEKGSLKPDYEETTDRHEWVNEGEELRVC